MSKSAIKNMMFFFVCFLIAFFVGLSLGFRFKKETIQFVEIEKTKYEIVYIKDNIEKVKMEETKEVEMLLTAYCQCEACCDDYAKNRPIGQDGNPIVYTASGTVAKQGRTVAADPSVYPYGTILEIEGKEYIVEDCGGAIKGGKRIDIYFENHSDALTFGKKTLSVVVKGVKK